MGLKENPVFKRSEKNKIPAAGDGEGFRLKVASLDNYCNTFYHTLLLGP